MSLKEPDSRLELDVRVADQRWEDVLGDVDTFCARVLACAAAYMNAKGEVSVLFTADPEIQELNREWRGIDKPTDVLSFPYSGPDLPGGVQPLGDIALAFETSMRDAQSMERAMPRHAAHLLVHGFLHLLGHDHIEPGDAAVMEPLEVAILAQLGWPDPYDSRFEGEA